VAYTLDEIQSWIVHPFTVKWLLPQIEKAEKRLVVDLEKKEFKDLQELTLTRRELELVRKFKEPATLLADLQRREKLRSNESETD
jgi:hypothetical protein